jgi:hypothetical protein
VTKLTVHICLTCGEQTIWTPDGPLHEGNISDHLADPGRIVTLDWDAQSSNVTVVNDVGEQTNRTGVS